MRNSDMFNAASKISSSEKLKIVSPASLEVKYEFEKNISPDMISIVIPVKNNQKGIDRLLESILSTEKQFYPKEVIIVDNNSDNALFLAAQYPFPIHILRCSQKGPAAARNKGVLNATGKWILFIDSDCIFTPVLISGYISDNNDSIGYAGAVKIIGDDILSNYYRDQNALHPMSMFNKESGELEPSTLVTANCLILKSAFNAINGFNEGFIYAGGEDTDLGYRLKRIGKIRFNQNSEVLHEFGDGFRGLVKRYIRYGKGNKKLEDLYNIDFSPQHFLPNNPSIRNRILAFITVEAMRYGYKSIK
jgi:glycosyltransferase involved in cell wall biosynthesis